jgi:hypothetical protein
MLATRLTVKLLREQRLELLRELDPREFAILSALADYPTRAGPFR